MPRHKLLNNTHLLTPSSSAKMSPSLRTAFIPSNSFFRASNSHPIDHSHSLKYPEFIKKAYSQLDYWVRKGCNDAQSKSKPVLIFAGVTAERPETILAQIMLQAITHDEGVEHLWVEEFPVKLPIGVEECSSRLLTHGMDKYFNSENHIMGIDNRFISYILANKNYTMKIRGLVGDNEAGFNTESDHIGAMSNKLIDFNNNALVFVDTNYMDRMTESPDLQDKYELVKIDIKAHWYMDGLFSPETRRFLAKAEIGSKQNPYEYFNTAIPKVLDYCLEKTLAKEIAGRDSHFSL